MTRKKNLNTSEIQEKINAMQEERREFLKRERELRKQYKEQERKERTHRLCTRGGMLETFLSDPLGITDEEVEHILKTALGHPEVKSRLKNVLKTEETAPQSRS